MSQPFTPSPVRMPAERNSSAGMRRVAAGRFRLGECAVDAARGCIERGSTVMHVEPRVMDVLAVLVSGSNRTLSRDELIESVWGHPNVADEALSRCISLLRMALGDDRRNPRFIETVPKRGYRLIVPVEISHPGPTHIAVLPFVNLSSDTGVQPLADGLTELLISYASEQTTLRVTSRTSSMRYRDSPLRMSEIARKLDVTHLVEGSVLTAASAMQAVMRIVDPASEASVLVRSYRRALTDALRVQNEIAMSMATAIAAAITE